MNYTAESRQKALEQFVQNHFAKDYQSILPIEGDAGFRSYFRINLNVASSYILMDCPPNYCSIEPFIEIANYLRSHAFSAPDIIAFDLDNGFLILEDFGNLSVKNFIVNSSDQIRKNIYYFIVDILIALQDKAPPTNLKIYNDELLISELSVFEQFYIPYVLKRNLSHHESTEYKTIWQEILANQIPSKNSIVLRDYHVENMMYLKNKEGINSLGLLDFQDALIGSPIYDLVSVLEDARIEVSYSLAFDCIKYFAEQKKLILEDVLTNYHILGAQRNSRILGVFARKSIRDKNDNYLQYMPLVLKYLENDLSHPIMAKLKNWHNKILK